MSRQNQTNVRKAIAQRVKPSQLPQLESTTWEELNDEQLTTVVGGTIVADQNQPNPPYPPGPY